MGSEKGIGAAGRGMGGSTKVTPPSAEEARASILPQNGHLQDGVGADGSGPEFIFDLDYLDQRGRRWTGSFKGHVLTVKDRISVGLTKSRYAAGVTPAQLDLGTDILLEMVAHLSVAIDEAPPWARDPMAIYDQGAIGAIYEEVVTREARFHGTKLAASGEVDGGGGDGGVDP